MIANQSKSEPENRLLMTIDEHAKVAGFSGKDAFY